MSQGMWWLPGTGKGKETDLLTEPLEGAHPFQHLEFSSVRPISDF